MPGKTKETNRDRRSKKTGERVSRREQPQPRHSARHTWVLFALLAAVTLAVYFPVASHPFANFDDPEYVTDNLHVRAGLTVATVRWALVATELSNWHPLTWLSYALDFELFGLSASGYHISNLLLHIANVLLLFWLLQRATGAVLRSAMVAALFALHPLNVESVAWIAERKNLLCTLFIFLALGAYGWYAQRPNWRRYLVVAAAFVCALASKPMAITLPFALLLLDYWPLQHIAGWGAPSQALRIPQQAFPRLLLEKLPLLLLSAGSAVITVIVQRGSLAGVQQFGYGVRLENAIYSYGMYLVKTLWPVSLALFYPHPGNSLAAWKVVLAGAFLLAGSVSVVLWARARAYLLVGWCWFLGTLVPVIGIVQAGGQGMADRYAYIPLIGVFVMVVWGAAEFAESRRASLTAEAMGAALVVLMLAFFTWRQNGYWKSNVELWSHTLDVTANNLIAEDKLGVALQAVGQHEEGMVHFSNAVRLNPLDPLSNFNVGADLHARGNMQEAIPHYEITIRQTTDSRLMADAYQNLGTAYLQLGDSPRAREQFLLALRANPGLTTVFAGLGELENEPIRALSRSVVEQPTADGYLRLAQLFQQAGHLPEARLAYAEALRLNPALEEARQALSRLDGHRE